MIVTAATTATQITFITELVEQQIAGLLLFARLL
jgi:hypothetical protein